jgi:hypothetical protein
VEAPFRRPAREYVKEVVRMDRGNAPDPTRREGASTQGQGDAARPALGIEPVQASEKQHGAIASVIKGAFKLYLVPAMRAQDALAAVTGSWSDIVAEARQEREIGRRTDELKGSGAGTDGAVRATPAPVAESEAAQRSTPRPPVGPGGAGKTRATDAKRDPVAAPSQGREGVIDTSPSMPGPVEAEASAPPTPTLVETGESSVEVRPNPIISPPHVTSGVIAHIPPEVRHKLAGDGPVRA